MNVERGPLAPSFMNYVPGPNATPVSKVTFLDGETNIGSRCFASLAEADRWILGRLLPEYRRDWKHGGYMKTSWRVCWGGGESIDFRLNVNKDIGLSPLSEVIWTTWARLGGVAPEHSEEFALRMQHYREMVARQIGEPLERMMEDMRWALESKALKEVV